MARGDQRDQGREGSDWQSGSRAGGGRDAQAEREERGRWGRDSRSEQSWRPEYDTQSGRDQDDQGRYRPDSGRSREWSRDRERDGGEYSGQFQRGEQDHPDWRVGSRGIEYRREHGFGEYGRGEQPRGGYGRERQPETYSDMDRWERKSVDMGPDRGGGAYAGGSSGGGAYGPGGFGGPSTDRHWMGAGGGGHAPEWTTDREQYTARTGRPTHSGKGPKGYQRSSERITEDVCEALTRHPDIDASEISVRCENGEVVLSGTVNDRREKRMAEDAAERIAGVNDVRNEIRVNRQGSSGYEPSQGRQAQLEGGANRTSETEEDEQTRRGSSASRNRTGSKS